MRRAQAAAAVGGCLLAVVLTGCGVQSTGVHVAMTAPITVSAATPSASASRAGTGGHPVQIFLTSPRNQLIPVTRYVTEKPSPTTILAEFAKPLTKDEEDSGYSTAVPIELTLKPTSNAHEFVGWVGSAGSAGLKPLTSVAQLQVICSLDVYWLQNPDQFKPSSRLIVNGFATGFDDCPNYAQAAANQTALPGPTAVKAGAPSPAPSPVRTP